MNKERESEQEREVNGEREIEWTREKGKYREKNGEWTKQWNLTERLWKLCEEGKQINKKIQVNKYTNSI